MQGKEDAGLEVRGMSDRRVKVGIIGAGGMAKVHSKILSDIDGVNIVAVADIDGEKAKQIANSYNAKYYTDYSDLIAADIDAVFVLTPPFVRCDPIIMAAKAGKHIFCEKPIALNLKEAEDIVKIVQETKIKFMMGYVLRFFPTFKKLKDIFDEGRLGELVSCWTRRITFFDTSTMWVSDPQKGGGMILEFYTHDIDWLRWIGGNPIEVYGKTIRVNPRITTEDNVFMMLIFGKGVGMSYASWSSILGEANVGIIGTEGGVILNDEIIRLRVKGEEGEKKISVENLNPYEQEDRHFIESIINDRIPAVNEEDGLKALKIAWSLKESVREGMPVKLGDKI